MYKRLFLLIISIIILYSCKNKNVKVNDFDILLNQALELTNRGKYQQSINMLDKLLIDFPNQDVIVLYYNIGYNHYQLRDYNKANNYFDKVDNEFEKSSYTQDQKESYVKYTILSNVIRKKIETDIIDSKDPYHIKEDVDNYKKNKAKRPKK